MKIDGIKKTVLPRHWPCGWLKGAKAGWVMRCFGSKTVAEPTKPTTTWKI